MTKNTLRRKLASFTIHKKAKPPKPQKQTLEKYIERYFATYGDTWKHSTRKTYEELLGYILPALGQKCLEEIDKEQMVEFFKDLIKRLSASRVRMTLSLLNSVFKDAHDNDKIKNNPVAKARAEVLKRLRKNAMEKPVSTSEQAYTLEEVEACLKHVDPHYLPLFTTLAFTAARPNEALALRWSDLDFKSGTLTLSKGRVKGVEGKTKTMRSRTIPMHPRVKAALKKLSKERFGEVTPETDLTAHVFLNKRSGEPIDSTINTNLQAIWKRAEDAAGVPHRRMYLLRHSMASACAAAGMDQVVVAALLGHSDVKTTQKYYLKQTADTLGEMSKTLKTIEGRE